MITAADELSALLLESVA